MSQNLHENTCAEVSFSIKLQASGLQFYFLGEFWKIFKNSFFIEHLAGCRVPAVINGQGNLKSTGCYTSRSLSSKIGFFLYLYFFKVQMV